MVENIIKIGNVDHHYEFFDLIKSMHVI